MPSPFVVFRDLKVAEHRFHILDSTVRSSHLLVCLTYKKIGEDYK